MTPIKLYMLVFPLFIAAIAAEAAYFRWGPERRTGSARVAPENAAEAPEPLHG